MGRGTGRLVVVVAAGVHVAIEAGKVRAGDLDANAVAWGEVVAGVHGRQHNLVDLAGLHPDGLVVAVAPAQALDGLVEIVGGAVGIDIEDLCGNVSVLDVGGDVERYVHRAGDLQT